MSKTKRSSAFTNCSELYKYIKNQRARTHNIILITQLREIFTSSVPRITLTNHFIQTTTKSIQKYMNTMKIFGSP